MRQFSRSTLRSSWDAAQYLSTSKAAPIGVPQRCANGIGAPSHLAMEYLRSMTGIDVLHVPFKGGAQAVTGLLGGQVDIVVDGAAMAQVKAGKLKALAVTGPRLPALPDVPGIGETVKGFSFTNWWGVLAPAGTPPDVVRRLNGELVAIAAMPDVRDKLRDLGLAAQADTPQEFADMLRTEAEKGKSYREGRRYQARVGVKNGCVLSETAVMRAISMTANGRFC